MPFRVSRSTTASTPQPTAQAQTERTGQSATASASPRNGTFSPLKRGGAHARGAPTASPGSAKTGSGAAHARNTERLASFLRRMHGAGTHRPTYGKPSHRGAGTYASPGFMARGYPQYVRPALNRSGYVSRLFGAGRPLGFTYGFGQISHGAGMHFGFHFNGRFHVLHLGVQPGTPQPFFAAVHSGYTHPQPPYWAYPNGHYAPQPAAWHTGYGHGAATYGAAVPPQGPRPQGAAGQGTARPRPQGAAGQGTPRPRPQGPTAQGTARPRPQRTQPQTGQPHQGQRPSGATGQGGPRPQGARPRPASTVDQRPPKGYRNWHEVLGVPHDSATRESVKSRYRKEALRLHPDKNRDKDTTTAFQELQWAHATAMAVLDARERGERVTVPPAAAPAAPAA